MESNPFQTALSEQLGPHYASIPDKNLFKNQPAYLREVSAPDNLSQIPVLLDSARLQMFSRITQCVRDGLAFALIKIDSDQLKAANEQIHHDFGDESIRASAGTITQTLATADLSCEHFVFRSSRAGDELVIFFLSPTSEDLEAITAFTQNINRRIQQVSLPTPSGSKKFTLSSSAGLASSVETVFKNDVENTRLQLKSNTIPHAYNLAHSLVDKANDRAGAIKVLHELTHFPMEELLSMDPLNYKNYIAKRQGGLRTSTAGWNILLMIDQIITARFLESKFPSSSQLHFDTAPLETSDPRSTPLLRRIISSYNQIFRN